ncbi:hypothetical protein DITRI_Ditri04bG0173500 [Diplodiscus trichospermus]
MALRPGRLIPDQKTLKVHCNGVSVGGQKNISKSPKKGVGTAGRKPLDTTTTSKIPFDANKKKSVSIASERVQIGARKALSDISNSIKPSVRETAEKNRNVKQSIVIEEECFLHNHQDCIKAQKLSMHKNQLLQMAGLDKDFSGQSALPRTPPTSNKRQLKSPLKISEPVEMVELMIEDQSPVKHSWSSKLASPSATRTPEPPSHIWAHHDCISYRLMETPELAKH